MGLEYPVELRSIESYVSQKHGSLRFIALNEIDVLDQWAGDIVDQIEREWPVDTSTSRDAFSYVLNQFGFTILNNCDYVEYITRAGETTVRDGGAPLYETLIPDVIDQYVPGLLAAMRDAVDATEAANQATTPTFRPARKPRGVVRG